MSLDDSTKEARKCKLRYNPVKKLMLRRHIWNFAKARATLAPTDQKPEFGFEYTFNLPPKCLRLIGIHPDYLDYRYEGARTIFSNHNPMRILYIEDIDDPTKFDQTFGEALACYLAYDICRAITDSEAIRAEMLDAYYNAIREAKFVNAIENPLAHIEADDLVYAHVGGYRRGFVRDPMT